MYNFPTNQVPVQKMNELNKKAFNGLLRLIITLAILLFLPAWSICYWQAWIFLLVFSIPVLAITLYLMKKDPKLLERRVYALQRLCTFHNTVFEYPTFMIIKSIQFLTLTLV